MAESFISESIESICKRWATFKEKSVSVKDATEHRAVGDDHKSTEKSADVTKSKNNNSITDDSDDAGNSTSKLMLHFLSLFFQYIYILF